MSSNRATRFVFLTLSSSFLLAQLVLYHHSCCATDTDTLLQGAEMEPGRLLVSSSGIFTLGFFFHDEVGMWRSYLGIWSGPSKNYGERRFVTSQSPLEEEPVWIANRDNPVMYTSVLAIDGNGSLNILSYKSELLITLYDSATSPLKNASATLQNDGNFVLSELNSDGYSRRIVWQSFDYPTDTLLPGMKLGINLKTGFSSSLTSWRSWGSPSTGSFTLGIDPNRSDQLTIWWQGQLYWEANIFQFIDLNFGFNFNYVSNEDERYLTYNVTGGPYATIVPRLTLTDEGQLMNYSSQTIDKVVSCGQFDDYYRISSSGCAKKKARVCEYGKFKLRNSFPKFEMHNGFMPADGFKFNEVENLTLFDCMVKCLNNCSCAAYASVYEDKTGCEIWSIKEISKKSATAYNNGRVIYLLKDTWNNKMWMCLTILVGGIMLIPPLCSICYVIWKKCIAKGDGEVKQRMLLQQLRGREIPSLSFCKPESQKKEGNDELRVFRLESIVVATSYFSMANQLGQGGYGPVYKGTLSDGREVAIKRLSRSSEQGMVEFKNEAMLIAKLQHTNLVKLLGFCIQGEEKILVYEYMPNKSLDSILFDCNKKKMLNWKRRFNIIEGIAQGLLYLHKYSRLRVIHRDLKASNILLDEEMNPKISDFGMARIFGLNELEANTNRVVGTYGYMSPEYAFHGLVSIKTDVYSFGVLILEVVSGKKNYNCYHFEHPLNLSGYAWQLWTEGRGVELVDPTLEELPPEDEILRCIHIGLLCVQDHAIDRPTMSDVVSMLSNESMLVAEPKQPAFFISAAIFPGVQGVGDQNKCKKCSINQVSISEMEAR